MRIQDYISSNSYPSAERIYTSLKSNAAPFSRQVRFFNCLFHYVEAIDTIFLFLNDRKQKVSVTIETAVADSLNFCLKFHSP